MAKRRQQPRRASPRPSRKKAQSKPQKPEKPHKASPPRAPARPKPIWPALKKAAGASKRLIAPGLAVVGAVLSTWLTLSSVAFEAKLLFIGACGLVVVGSLAWPIVTGLRLRLLQHAGIVAVAFAAAWAWSVVIDGDSIRIDYPRVPLAPTMSGQILVEAPRSPETFVLDIAVRNQTTPIVDFVPRSGPEGQSAAVEAQSLTPYDRQVYFKNFGDPHFARLSYTLSAPAMLVVDRRPPLGADVLFREDVEWYWWAVRIFGLGLVACGVMVLWWRALSRS